MRFLFGSRFSRLSFNSAWTFHANDRGGNRFVVIFRLCLLPADRGIDDDCAGHDGGCDGRMMLGHAIHRSMW